MKLLQTLLLPLFAIPVTAQDEKPYPADKDPKKTESGLEYSVLTPGDGKGSPVMGDKVKVHYTGWLLDGKEFDSSRKRGTPAEFVLGRVIEGWNEGLQLMSRGARFKFKILAKLGYGVRGSGASIPPNSDLIFDVELIDFTKGPKLPKWTTGDKSKQKKTESGLVYEFLAKGKGKNVEGDVIVEMEYALFSAKGKLLECTAQTKHKMKGKIGSLPFGFLNEAPKLMRIGDHVRLEVPPALCFGAQDKGPDMPANSTTIWELKLVSISVPPKMPEFSALKDPQITASGLKYEIVKAGTGKKPTLRNRVSCHYAGWLTDGTSFDSSFSRGEPSTFPLTGVIRGWTEGLQLMKEGAIFKFEIPGDLAYGQRGSGQKIGPNATLIFYIELKKIL